MAIYSCNISNVSRAKGSSSCATLAYISGEEVENELTGQTHKYGQQDRIIETGTIIPQFAPPEYQDPGKLFNAIEKFETASNARTAKKIMLALPKEFDSERQKNVVESYIKENITSKGYACTYAIHHDKNNNNPHCHILIANRQINQNGEWSTKSRKEYALDTNNTRIPQLDQDGNQKLGKRNEKLWKRISVQVNPLDTKEMLCELRERWADECNKYLAPEQQIDHRSYIVQGKEQEPTIHEGYVARKIEAQGGISDRCEINRAIIERNNLLKQIQTELQSLAERALVFVQEKGTSVNDRLGELLKRRTTVGADDKPSGGIADGERAITATETATENPTANTDTADLIREARAGIDNSRTKVLDSGANRADREAARERQRIATEQTAFERSRTEVIREPKQRTKSRGFER